MSKKNNNTSERSWELLPHQKILHQEIFAVMPDDPKKLYVNILQKKQVIK